MTRIIPLEENMPSDTTTTTSSSNVEKETTKAKLPRLCLKSFESLDLILSSNECVKLQTVLHDHCYMESEPASPASSLSPSPSLSSASSSSHDESLQNLFDNCDIDADFLSQATPNFHDFLEDLINTSDVHANDMGSYLDDSEYHVPTKSSWCRSPCVLASPSLFTCAGSTETRLSTCVMADSTPRSPVMSSVPLSLSSPSSCAVQPFIDLSPSSSYMADSSELDRKLLEVLAAICPENVCQSAQTSSSMDQTEQVHKVSCDISLEDSDVVSVSSSHSIHNGACLQCAPIPSTDLDSFVCDDVFVSSAPSVSSSSTSSSPSSSSSSPSTVVCPSSPSTEDSTCSERKRKSESDCGSLVKRSKLDSEDSEDFTSFHILSLEAESETQDIPSLDDLRVTDERFSLKHVEDDVRDFLSFDRSDKSSFLKVHPLSPFSVNQFGRCG